MKRSASFRAILARRYGRRLLLKAGAAAVGATALGAVPVAAQEAPRSWPFQPIGKHTDDWLAVSPGFRADVLIRWGDPLFKDAPAWSLDAQTGEAQSRQFGFANDFTAYLPLPAGSQESGRGLLWANHESAASVLMHPTYDPARPTRQQVDVEIAAIGGSVVEVWRGPYGWRCNESSRFNRRITMNTPIQITGPAAEHEWMRTNSDPSGTVVLGMLTNCAGGVTPWGTVLSGEEGFQGYFANLEALPANDPRRRAHARYGVTPKDSARRWERYYDRFDVGKEPNEPFRFGWVTENDPYDPTAMPAKRTALGRIKHEGAVTVTAPDGRVVVYSGDDERFEMIYKFVSARPWDPQNRRANWGLLDEGTLYVARFDADGGGEWLPLIFGQGRLTSANGFSSQADVLIRTREAAALVGGTPMDRPEDVEVSPVTGKVYAALTGNDQRGGNNRPAADAANPRSNNRFGHVIEWTEAGGDPTAMRFAWEIFLLCGDPKDEGTYFGGYAKEGVSPIATPDNFVFDKSGVLWIATDGMRDVLNLNDGLFAVPVEGPERGRVRQFLGVPAGGEPTGPSLTPDNGTLFLSIQHPGQTSPPGPPSHGWPDELGWARPSVVTITPADPLVADDATWAAAFERDHQRRPTARDRADRQWSIDVLKRTGRPPTLADWAARSELPN
jgi:hypothetical protein